MKLKNIVLFSIIVQALKNHPWILLYSALQKNWTVVLYYVVKWLFRPPSKKQNDTNGISF